MEQQAVIRFYDLLGKTATKTFESMKKAFGDNCLSRSRVFEWFNRFKEKQVSFEDNESMASHFKFIRRKHEKNS